MIAFAIIRTHPLGLATLSPNGLPMTPSDTTALRTTRQTGQAAMACLDALQSHGHPCGSPLDAVLEIANQLETRLAKHAWVIRSRPSHRESTSTRISAWPLRFLSSRSEKPLLYLLSSTTSAELGALSAETAGRGILCNDIETLPSPWPKGVQPALPLWLTSNPRCTPFDPASGAEARAVVIAALQALYVQGQLGFYYLALNDQGDGPNLDPQQTRDALKGMYRIENHGVPDKAPAVRLLGAGQALKEVQAAAALLHAEWGIASQVWSCPSYTRLARDAGAVARWNRLHPTEPKRRSHLELCLGNQRDPVLAMTGYGQSVVDPLGGFISARFVGLGAGSAEADRDPRNARAPQRYWIVALALRALADDLRIDSLKAEQALIRYDLK